MRNRLIIFAILVLLLVGTGAMFWWSEPATPPPVAPPIPTAPPVDLDVDDLENMVKVLNVRGQAMRRTSDGQWVAVGAGDALAVDDAVRTREESFVTLALGGESTVELSPEAEVEVRELSGAVQKLGLVSGRASVDYRNNGDRVLKIENEDGTVVAKVDQGKFSILNNGRLVAVATETGSVDLTSAGETVQVGEGTQSVAVAGKAPLDPFAISVGTLLKMVEGSCRVQASGAAIIRGSIRPGGTVRIAGRLVEVDESGRFMTFLNPSPRNGRVEIHQTDVWGKASKQVLTCVQPAQKAEIKAVDINWGKKG